ncbi:hypothetical protein [Geomicrobium sp. JCM 19038]|uniref:hypothetical protein n=1 Tax=Geomicrobium sp. JCM 19038 TaxID=1460635 RepID=UPI00045F3EBA|nr:hypothetical protein [Geomicrobium sp. JCM 19038]GAK10363.1 hypothetical protein JCM19038_4268 [Geomicrobium sp. JCM 19038]
MNSIEFFPEVTRLFETSPEPLVMNYTDHVFLVPSSSFRPPYYTEARYEPYYSDV